MRTPVSPGVYHIPVSSITVLASGDCLISCGPGHMSRQKGGDFLGRAPSGILAQETNGLSGFQAWCQLQLLTMENQKADPAAGPGQKQGITAGL